MTKRSCLALFALLALSTAPLAHAADDLATIHRSPTGISFDVKVDNGGATLVVTGPAGYLSRQSFDAGRDASFATSGLADGYYRFELRLSPRLDAATRQALAAARARGDESVQQDLVLQGKLPAEPQVVSGYLTIRGGSVVADDEVETTSRRVAAPAVEGDDGAATIAGATGGSRLEKVTAADFVIADDLIVDGSACVGFDCVDGESFGFDTIRLKENSTRIKFEDTSAAGFPSTDWQLTANDSASGGANKFSIDDITSARVPFTIEGGAPTSSLFVDDIGRVGLGTAVPVLDLHVVSSNTPAMRLEQDSSGGFTAQTWDIAGNEANFFVRDVTGGSRLPFRIRPGAPTSSIDVAADGDVGIGTASPAADVHVSRNEALTEPTVLIDQAGNTPVDTSILTVRNTNATNTVRDLLALQNNGRVRWRMQNTANGQILTMRLNENDFEVSFSSNVGTEMSLSSTGALTTLSSMNATAFNLTSDRNKKENFAPVDAKDVLSRVANLPITRWNFKSEGDGVQHIGPVAQDWNAAFGLGAGELSISVADSASVALVAIQALNQIVEQNQQTLSAKEKELETLKDQNQRLLERLEAIEAKIAH